MKAASLGAIGALACASLGDLSACKRASESTEPEKPVPIRCEAPKLTGVDDTLSVRGRIEPPPGGDLAVASQVPGRIAEVLVREGDLVRAGEVVAAIEGASTRDALRQAEAGVAVARATAANADATLARTQALVLRGIAAKQELEDVATRAQEAHANLAAAAAATDQARRTLGRVEVRSAFPGVVTKIWRGRGSLVDGTAATPVVELAALGGTEFVADVTAADLASLREGNRARGSLELGSTFEGVVRARGRALDPTTGLGAARIALDTPLDGVPMGAYGRAVVILKHRDEVPTLPLTALRGAVLDGSEVVICQPGPPSTAQLRSIRVGFRGADRFEVLSGVAPSERVAVDHVLGVEDGTPIAELP